MVNKHYLKGTRLERSIINHSKTKGILGIRSAGSKTPIDVVLIDEKNTKVYLIQCKAKKLTQNASKRLLDTLPRKDEYMIIPLIVSNLKEFKKLLEGEG